MMQAGKMARLLKKAREMGFEIGYAGESYGYCICGGNEELEAAYLAGHQAGVDKRTLEEKK